MVRAEVRRFVRCSPEAFLELVMDVEAYARIDAKLRSVDRVRRRGTTTEFRFRPALPARPGCSPTIVASMMLTPGERVESRYAPLPRNRVVNRLVGFAGTFAAAPAPDGTTVTRTMSIDVARPLGWFVEPVLRRRLTADLRSELRDAARRLEAGGSWGTARSGT